MENRPQKCKICKRVQLIIVFVNNRVHRNGFYFIQFKCCCLDIFVRLFGLFIDPEKKISGTMYAIFTVKIRFVTDYATEKYNNISNSMGIRRLPFNKINCPHKYIQVREYILNTNSKTKKSNSIYGKHTIVFSFFINL